MASSCVFDWGLMSHTIWKIFSLEIKMEGNEMQEEGKKVANCKNVQLLTSLFAHGWGKTAALDCICGLGSEGPNHLERHINKTLKWSVG